MPFIFTPLSATSKPVFYIIREAIPHTQKRQIIAKLAHSFIEQDKKVLIFDALLGLPNLPTQTKNKQKLTLFFNGYLPLSELIIHANGIDIITGTSQQNLNALSLTQRHKIKNDLIELAQNYDVVLIDYPYEITQHVFHDLGQTFWIVGPCEKNILATLRSVNTQAPHLIIDEDIRPEQLNHIYFFVKTLCPDCHIQTFPT